MTDTADAPQMTPEEAERAAAGAKLEADYAAWWAERQARGLALQNNSRQTWAAMEGWGALGTQEDWERLCQETAEDWVSGRAIITMLGGERYITPERTALLLLLWRQFIVAYAPEGPAEYMAVAMAVLSFAHFLRLNQFVGNLEMRLEDEMFATNGLRAQFEQRYRRGSEIRGLAVEEIVGQLGRDVLPLLDRLNRMVARNLRLLRDLKAAPLALTVQNFGQLNVAQAQTNVAQQPAGEHSPPPFEAEAEQKSRKDRADCR